MPKEFCWHFPSTTGFIFLPAWLISAYFSVSTLKPVATAKNETVMNWMKSIYIALSYRVVSLARLVHTLPLEADTPLSTGRPLHGGKLLGQADHLALANDGTPEAGTHVHSGADSVLGSEGQSTLAHGIIALSWEFLRAQQGLAGWVQEALGCIRERVEKTCFKIWRLIVPRDSF